MIYCDTFTLTVGTGGVIGSEHIFRLNSLYDPDFTIGGHQPYGYDQVAALYRKYRVEGCRCEVTITNASEDGIAAFLMLQPSDGTYALAAQGTAYALEKPGCIMRVLNDSGSQVEKIDQYVPIHTVEGLKKNVTEADLTEYSAAVTTNPTKFPYLRMAIGSLANNTGGTVQVMVKLTFDAKFFERIILSSS
jgi:hypothetical protein